MTGENHDSRPVQVRLHQPGDEAEWLRLRAALWPRAGLEELRTELAGWLAHPDTCVVVAPRDGGGLAGFAEVGTRSVADGCDTSPVAYLEGWYVDPDQRRRGIGRALLRAAEDWARRQGYREFASDVELPNTGSQRAHKALGFAETSRVVTYMKRL